MDEEKKNENRQKSSSCTDPNSVNPYSCSLRVRSSLFYRSFLPGSQVNGFNCSYKTAEETENLLAKEVQAYVLTVETRNNGKESITAKKPDWCINQVTGQRN